MRAGTRGREGGREGREGCMYLCMYMYVYMYVYIDLRQGVGKKERKEGRSMILRHRNRNKTYGRLCMREGLSAYCILILESDFRVSYCTLAFYL